MTCPETVPPPDTYRDIVQPFSNIIEIVKNIGADNLCDVCSWDRWFAINKHNERVCKTCFING